MPAEAVEAALSAGDFARAARLIDIDSPLVRSMFIGYEARTLIGWLERFPQEVLFTHAHLCLVYAISLGISDVSDAHEGPLAVAEQLFQAEGNRKGLGQAYMLRALAAGLRGDAVHAIRYGTQAFELLPEDDMLARSTAASALAEGYRLGGEVVAASRVLSESRRLHEQAGNINSILGDTIALGDLLVMQGRLHEAADTYGAVLEAAGKRQSYAIRALIGLGNIACERNELDAAETHLEQAVTIANEIGDQVMLVRASLLRARAVQARGDGERTRDAWAGALGLAQACGYLGLVEQAQAYQVRGWLQSGRVDDVIRWQQACPLSHDVPPTYQQEITALTLVRVLLSRWKGKGGADYVHRLLSVLQAEQLAHGSLSLAAPHREPPLEPLTNRERKVLQRLSAGLSNAEIAAELVVSINTVRTQARSIYRKLNVKNRHEAVVTAQTWKLL
jgi:LuxR family transcriptional regulator, maltose regulon positive regulatory protein